MTKRKDDVVIPEADGFALTGDGKKLLYRSGPQGWYLTAAATAKPGDGRLNLANADIRIEPRAEWAQMLDEAWRINRDYFYATNYHGADWKAEKAKYAAFLPSLASRGDLERVIRWMLSELRVGHSYQGPGQRLENPARVGVGLLGADYEVANGKWRITRVLGGVNWNPTLRAPLTEPGVNVRAGEYLLAVNGIPLDASTSVYAPFENTVDRAVDITVGPNADGSGSRVVQVVPAGSESALRNRAWIEGNIRKVDSATGGRVAYVYVPNTAGAGYESFRRYFYPQAHKDAIIVDERFNGGGPLADYPIDMLRRPALSYWAMRYGDDLRTPAASIQGPRRCSSTRQPAPAATTSPGCSGSSSIGPLIGQRTWGGLVGILGYPAAHGWRHGHIAEPRDLDAGGRVHRRERRSGAGHRRGADAEGRDRGTRSAARARDRVGDGRAQEESAQGGEAAAVSGQDDAAVVRSEVSRSRGLKVSRSQGLEALSRHDQPGDHRDHRRRGARLERRRPAGPWYRAPKTSPAGSAATPASAWALPNARPCSALARARRRPDGRRPRTAR